ncbi:MAG TPA: SIMPL domain-containing protein [Defluviitaleaceae bacterium]|nr:SIMPL domain-containing protein [Defluviitaleaceae bacterium]HPT75147.1 SIMPL domain-containing protein [Defluviitaleaceae bacterium]
MKKTIKLLSVLLLAVFFTTASLSSPAVVKAETGINKITVRGEGVIKVKPDMAYITLGVRTENKDAKQAQKENANKMNQVIAAVKNMGIDEKDIQTSGYSVYPQYDYESKTGERIVGYTVTNTISVTVRDISKVGELLDLAVKEGANLSGGIQFSVSDTEKYYNEALKQAIKNAQGKAAAIGEALGVVIKAPVSVVETSYGGRSVVYADEESFKTNAVSTPVEIGEMDINAIVEVIYQY